MAAVFISVSQSYNSTLLPAGTPPIVAKYPTEVDKDTWGRGCRFSVSINLIGWCLFAALVFEVFSKLDRTPASHPP